MSKKKDMFLFIELAIVDLPANYSDYYRIIAEVDKLHQVSMFYEKYCLLNETQEADPTLPYTIFKSLTEKKRKSSSSNNENKEKNKKSRKSSSSTTIRAKDNNDTTTTSDSSMFKRTGSRSRSIA
jgi:hypothetical protein